MSRWIGVIVVLASACGDDGGGGSASTGSGSNSASGSNSLSAEDGPSPTCEPEGGTCACVGTCNAGYVAAPMFTCGQGPDSSGACSLECCLPEGESADSGSSAGTSSAGTSSAETTAESGGPICDCPSLPACMTAMDEDCAGMYPTGRCCDAAAAIFHCACIEPCTGSYPCCVLSDGCE